MTMKYPHIVTNFDGNGFAAHTTIHTDPHTAYDIDAPDLPAELRPIAERARARRTADNAEHSARLNYDPNTYPRVVHHRKRCDFVVGTTVELSPTEHYDPDIRTDPRHDTELSKLARANADAENLSAFAYIKKRLDHCDNKRCGLDSGRADTAPTPPLTYRQRLRTWINENALMRGRNNPAPCGHLVLRPLADHIPTTTPGLTT